MKKYLIHITMILAAVSVISFNGCDQFDALPINVPLTVTVAVSGNSTSLSETKSFCFDQYESYNTIKEDIKKLTYIESALRVDSVSNANLTGNIRVEVKNSTGQSIFFVIFNNVKPANYIKNPLVLPLDVNQVKAINQYIENLENKCFTAEVQVYNISGGSAPYYVRVLIDMVFEAETEL